ncbi:potassium channel family protein [Sulfurovum sp. NBC37-1]|uniref:potassium channel family protein n=1 Tax=Sulfurovum sp. (strain NBC37-1) TaxID=387093 RepID=UPI0001587CC8|nr:potassium channel family protein [Sulfurovum sp. NBC37-1]BAF72294.1 K+ channel protein [Sulfurovum sp. NBC37-1]
MKKITRKNNFFYLFFALVILLFSAAVVAEVQGSMMEDLFSFMTVLMLLASIKSLKTDVTVKWFIYLVIAVFIVLTLLGKFFPHHFDVYFILFTLLLFFVGAFAAAFRQVLFVGDIDGNKIIGSMTLYLLLGLIWAMIYLIILATDHQAFSGIEAGSWQQIFARVAYYSFVTLTTLGYGDILPTNHIAEFFVSMEAVFGVFYMAIIVSSLISLHLSAIQEKRADEVCRKEEPK